jgi:transposase-like protein
LTPQEADGRSNRRRFSDEQKRAMVQETEKPGVAVAEVCRRHGIATSLLFRWRVQFGLTAEKRHNWQRWRSPMARRMTCPRLLPCAISCSRLMA